MFVLSHKLKLLKSVLKVWNKEKVGDVYKQVDIAIKNLKAVQDEIASAGCFDELLVQEESAQLEFNKALQVQELFWKEKARVDWHTNGDKNTAFFHKLGKIIYASRRISLLKDGDSVLDSQEDIESHVLSYYENLFASPDSYVDNGLIDEVISPKV